LELGSRKEVPHKNTHYGLEMKAKASFSSRISSEYSFYLYIFAKNVNNYVNNVNNYDTAVWGNCITFYIKIRHCFKYYQAAFHLSVN
jgi:hypothetical protein